MWRRWTKSPVQLHPPSSNPSFSSTSFKDIHNLFTDDDDSPVPNTKLSSIFHRVRAANSILRSFSATPEVSDSQFDSQPHNNVLPALKTPPPSPSPPQSSLPQSELQEPAPPPQSNPPQSELQEPAPQPPSITIPGAEKQIVIYFTSLRVVRSTFEDCRFVQTLLRTFRVSIDERDLAMDSSFIKELQQIFGGGGQTKLTLPCVFIGGRYIGGADEIRDLHDAGELKKLVKGLPAAEPGACHVCGGYKFILCTDCNGSHKMYTEKFAFRSCIACNENGLIRCPSCSSCSSFC
ncbi:uncharacterized protein At5g39865 [Euphorbia lathyris]|uniref:uncharacterized protein At5g39865 n=1 Tax=Euphorbia lathyris TaxID=212925 RepID=UPI003313A95A